MVDALTRIVKNEDYSREDDEKSQEQELAEIEQSGDELIADFRLHYPLVYVIKTWFHFKERNIFPRMGGYDDQDDLLMTDWEWLDRAYAHIQKEYEYNKKYPPFGSSGGSGGVSLSEVRNDG